MKTNTLIILLVVVIGAVALMTLPQFIQNNDGNGSSQIKVSADDHKKGLENAPVVLVEYSDFECPACRAYFPIVSAINEEYKDKITFVYKHFPLSNIHVRATGAAIAAEAAGRQGKFWQMHDLLFETQDVWSREGVARDQFIALATQLELDIEKFTQDMDDQILSDKVDRNFQEGFSEGVQGTPTFFINGEKIANPRGFEDFQRAIDEVLAESANEEKLESETDNTEDAENEMDEDEDSNDTATTTKDDPTQ